MCVPRCYVALRMGGGTGGQKIRWSARRPNNEGSNKATAWKGSKQWPEQQPICESPPSKRQRMQLPIRGNVSKWRRSLRGMCHLRRLILCRHTSGSGTSGLRNINLEQHSRQGQPARVAGGNGCRGAGSEHATAFHIYERVIRAIFGFIS